LNSILVVDDESGIRELLTRWLSSDGYTVRSAETAEAALLEMDAAPADVVFCDVEMPGQGGLWLAAQLIERFPTAAMVLATGVDSVPPTTSFKPGIVEYLVKPLDRAGVLNAVKAGIRWHDAATMRPAPDGKHEERLTDWLDADEKDS
jgi:DNA-binding NtrC family response regulator